MSGKEQTTYTTRRALAKRWDRTERTVDRWVRNPALNFPRAVLINGRQYFDEAEIEAWELAMKAARFGVAA